MTGPGSAPPRPRWRRRQAIAGAIALLAVAIAVLAILLGRGHQGSSPGPRRPGPSASAGGQGGAPAVLSGTIVDASSRAPLGGAMVRVEGARGATTARTDATGHYQVAISGSGPIAVTVDDTGYRGEVAFGSVCPGEQVTFSPALTQASPTGPPPAPVAISGRGGCA